MKKLTCLLLLFSVTAVFFSCRDESGDFEEQLFTTEQITFALKQCIDSTMVRTCNTLCVVDTVKQKLGFSYFDSENYHIDLPAATKVVLDTLIQYGYKGKLDTLVMNLNRAAEKCGNKIVQFWRDTIPKITFPNPKLLLHESESAITKYVKETKQTEFISKLASSTLLEQFRELEIISTWNSFQKDYFEITTQFVSIDILTPAAQQMADGFFRKMAVEEKKIRENPELRGGKENWLYKVFATL